VPDSGSEPDATEKTFDATPQKIQRAREKGDVAKSTDLIYAAALLGFLLAAISFGATSVTRFGSVLQNLWTWAPEWSEQVFSGPSGFVLAPMINAALWAVSPIFIVPFSLVIISILIQKAFVFSSERIKPKLSKVSLISNAKNKFGLNGLVEFGKSFFKLSLYSILLAVYLNGNAENLLSLIGQSVGQIQLHLARMCLEFMLLALIIAAVIGVVDAFWQHYRHRQKLLMSRKEVQDEFKESEGDPQLKQRRREKAEHLVANKMISEIPNANVLIVNPTHYAIALSWDGGTSTAPICVAKGVDHLALTMRRVASESGVPIRHDPPTARALHGILEIGDEVPPELFVPVAAAIRFASEMKNKVRY
jgi:flagellar biosynthetic protein FlhB